jgi:phosphoglycerate kinase
MKGKIPTLADLESEAGDIAGLRVLVRVDFNVPVQDGVIVDDYRIQKTLPTIQWLSSRGAKLRMVSHITNVESLAVVVQYLNDNGVPCALVEEIGDAVAIEAADTEGKAVLFENIRKYPGEEKNDSQFAQMLAACADIYVNEGFSVSHRAHASVCGVAGLLTSYAGLNFAKEVEYISALSAPEHPFVAIIGGAKFDTKLPLIRRLLSIADKVCVVGALAHDIYKARGLEIGKSPHSDGVDVTDIAADPKIWVPHDMVVTDASLTVPGKVVEVGALSADDIIMDAGAASVVEMLSFVTDAKTVVWNGPVGFNEKGFTIGTETFARGLAKLPATRILGGGDTLAVLTRLDLLDSYTFVSTGGGAMLDFLATGTLPGVDCLIKE